MPSGMTRRESKEFFSSSKSRSGGARGSHDVKAPREFSREGSAEIGTADGGVKRGAEEVGAR